MSPRTTLPQPSPGISRVDQPSTRTHGYVARLGYRQTDAGWRPAFKAFFGDASNGGPTGALKAAEAWLKVTRRKAGVAAPKTATPAARKAKAAAKPAKAAPKKVAKKVAKPATKKAVRAVKPAKGTKGTKGTKPAGKRASTKRATTKRVAAKRGAVRVAARQRKAAASAR